MSVKQLKLWFVKRRFYSGNWAKARHGRIRRIVFRTDRAYEPFSFSSKPAAERFLKLAKAQDDCWDRCEYAVDYEFVASRSQGVAGAEHPTLKDGA